MTLRHGPFGHPDYIRRFLEGKTDFHRRVLERILAVPDVQAGWLFLTHCATTRAIFFTRGVNPNRSEAFARAHDKASGSVSVESWFVSMW